MKNESQRSFGHPERVQVVLPEWLWGGDARRFGRAVGWRLVGSSTGGSGLYDIQLQDATQRRPISMVRVEKIAHRGNIDSPGTFARFKNMPPHDVFMADVDTGGINDELDWIAKHHPSIGGVLAQATIATTFSSEADLERTVRDVVTGQPLPVLQGAVVYLLRMDPRLEYRYAMPRVLLQGDANPQDLAAAVEESQVFESSRNLLGDTMYGLASYLAPLFLCASPWIWGFPVPRAGAVIVYSMGEFVAGREGLAVEPLQLFHPRGASTSLGRPAVQSGDLQDSLSWWVGQLNQLFFEVTDPCNYSSKGGRFLYWRQLESFLSLEQLFRNVQSMLALDRDDHARRSLFFDSIDTFHGLRLLSFDEMCRYEQATKALDELRGTIPAAVQKVLLPKAERSVEALKELQEGFFLKSRVTENGVMLPDKSGQYREVDKARAAAWWLRVLRNAGHSFTPKEGSRTRDETLLACHDGHLPDGVADLAYLYLLRLLARPSLLRSGPLNE